MKNPRNPSSIIPKMVYNFQLSSTVSSKANVMKTTAEYAMIKIIINELNTLLFKSAPILFLKPFMPLK
jgi:hypothetical protein